MLKKTKMRKDFDEVWSLLYPCMHYVKLTFSSLASLRCAARSLRGPAFRLTWRCITLTLMWSVWETPAPGKSPSCLGPSTCSSRRWPSPSSHPSSPSVRTYGPYRQSFSMHPNRLINDKAASDKSYVIILWWAFSLNIRNVLINSDFVVAHTFIDLFS